MTLSSHSAPGANAGFCYQFERALYWLAQSPAGSVVGIETNDDVAIRQADGAEVLEQDKHSIQEEGEPFGNRSKDLWNTLAIWLEALDTKQVSPNTGFFMVTNKVLPDCIAHQIGRAKSKLEIAECIQALKLAAKSPPEKIAVIVNRVLRPDSQGNLALLIANCEMCDGAKKTAGAELRKEIIARLQLPEWCSGIADSIVDELLGWLHATALGIWQAQQPAWIQRNHFVNQLHAVIDLRKRQMRRERSENLIPVPDEKVGQEKGRPFVKQLHWVTDDEAIVDNSIRDFIRCNIEKSRLSAEGNITDDDWTAFEATLLARWEKIKSRVIRIRKANPEADIGFEIFMETTEAHREKLAGADTEQVYLTAGTYHRLADLVRVGWHPRFKELVSALTKTP